MGKIENKNEMQNKHKVSKIKHSDCYLKIFLAFMIMT